MVAAAYFSLTGFVFPGADQPDAADVRLGVVYNDSLTTGTAAIPAASNVRFGTAVDAGAGTAYIPLAYDVRLDTPVDNTTGTLIVPDPSQVQNGVGVDHTVGTFGLGATMTLATSSTSYATPADTLARLDIRTVGDLCSDTGTRIAAMPVLTNNNFLQAIRDASAEVEKNALIGGRYSVGDLQTIANSTGVAAGVMLRLISRLTCVFLFERRPDMELKQPWIWEQAEKDLEALREGKNIFSFAETAAAGIQSHEVETARQIERREGVVVQSERYFGRQPNRRDPRRQ